MILGMAGYARVGKDTVADMLVRHYGFKKFAFADLLRDFVWDLDPLIADGIRWRDPVRMHGYEQAKDMYPEIRGVLQRTGAAARNLLDPDVWVKPVVELASEHPRAVISDVRYPNEANAIESFPDGFVVRITRPGHGPVNGHISETALDEWPCRYGIQNSGSLGALALSVVNLMEELL